MLQADHGAKYFEGETEEERKNSLKILNAIYLFDGNYSQLNPTTTPVNTFRVIFNQYFGAHFKLLPDRSFFSYWGSPYDFSPVN